MVLVSSMFLWKLKVWSSPRFGRLMPSLLLSLFSVAELFLRAWISCMVGLRGTSSIAFILDDTYHKLHIEGVFLQHNSRFCHTTREDCSGYLASANFTSASKWNQNSLRSTTCGISDWIYGCIFSVHLVSSSRRTKTNPIQQPCYKSYIYEAYNVQFSSMTDTHIDLRHINIWFEAF